MPRRCPTCESIYGDSVDLCPEDETPLEEWDAEDDELIGENIEGRFRLDGLLGAGGMGRVYRGTQLSVDREVAVKIIRGEAVPDGTMRNRFVREARIISGFSDPNIIRLIEFGRWDRIAAPYLVMEFAGGVSLSDLVDEGRLQPAFAVEIARQVCSGLVEAHRAEVVHRDLKPDNLHLIDRADRSFLVKILDFGIAYPQDSSENLTGTGMMCGTAAYVSPEQAQGADLDGRADLYSLGIILFEMLTGVRPFRGDSGFELLMQQVEEPPPDLNDYVPADALPPDLIKLVYELLEKDPANRPSSAEAVRDRLEAIAETLGTAVELADETTGIARYGSWVLPAVPEEAPIHESDTRAPEDRSPVPTAGTEDVPSPPDPWAATAKRGSSTIEHRDATDADSAESTAEPSSDRSTRSGRSALLRYGIPFLAGVVGVVLVTWMIAELTGSAGGSKSSASTNEPVVATADDGPLNPVSGSLETYAGRCVGVGRGTGDLRSVYFYPELGELLFRRSGGIEWNHLEIAGRRDDRIYFRYGPPASRGEAGRVKHGTVLASADKRIFRFGDDTTYTCRRETWGAYYEDLDLEGEWRAVEADRRLVFPEAGQRFTFRRAGTRHDGDRRDREMRYRVLSGTPGRGNATLAVVSGGVENDDWERWRLQYLPGEKALRVRRAWQSGRTRTHRFERPDDRDDEPPEVAADDEGASRAPTAELKPEPSLAPTSTTADAPALAPGSSGSAGAAPTSGGGSGSSATKKAWRSRLDRILEKCRSATATIEQNNARYERLAEQDKEEAAERAKEKRNRENPKAVDTLQKMGSKFSELVEEMTTAGAPGHRVQSYTSEYLRVCEIE